MLSPGNAYPKSVQLRHKRVKPTQKQMGDISAKVRNQVKARSNGVCELCKAAHAVHMAHLIGRKQLTARTTADILLHVCVPCHKYLDENPEGIQLRRRLAQ